MAFENADDALMVDKLFEGMGTDINNFVPFGSEDNVTDPWDALNGACLALSNFTVIQNALVASIMDRIGERGRQENGRYTEGFFFTPVGVYHEISSITSLGGGVGTYRVLGYDYGGEENPEFRVANKRVVELPWQLAPHGVAMYTELANPEEYGPNDKIAYHLISPYLGNILVKMECCTEYEVNMYQNISEYTTGGFHESPQPPVDFSVNAAACEAMQPVVVHRHD